MIDQASIDAAELRCAELLEMWLRDQRTAEFHKRHGHPDADRYVRRAAAVKQDYDAAVRDLERARQGL